MSTATTTAPEKSTNGNDLDLSGVLDLLPPKTEAAAAGAAPAKPAARAAKSQSRGKQILYFDLETVPDESRLDSFMLDPLPVPLPRRDITQCPAIEAVLGYSLESLKKMLLELNPDDAWLDQLEAAENAKGTNGGKDKPRKVALDAIAEIRGQADTLAGKTEERRKLLSVTPEFNKIVAVGWATGDDVTEAMVVGAPLGNSETVKISEIDAIDKLWSLIGSGGPIVGYNIAGFDLPTLFIRSAILGLKPPRRLDLRPWGDDVVDLMQARFPKGASRKLKELAAYYGFAVPAGDFEGSKVYETWKAGEFNQIAAYVRSDVEISRRLHSFYRGFFCA